jgi:hypothetical protein
MFAIRDGSKEAIESSPCTYWMIAPKRRGRRKRNKLANVNGIIEMRSGESAGSSPGLIF